MAKLFLLFVFVLFAAGLFLFFSKERVNVIVPEESFKGTSVLSDKVELQILPEAEKPSGTISSAADNSLQDVPPERQLQNPPSFIKGIYATAWSAGSDKKLDSLIKFIKGNNLNAVVIDVKDYSGYVSYRMDIDALKKAGADKDIRILKPNLMIKKLHENGIYAIARITVFQDPILAKARPDLAVKIKGSDKVWKDNKGLSWLDPASKEVWDYHISIAKDALARGFDEINFDYIRFPSDGKLNLASYPFWDGARPMDSVIREFFGYLRKELGDAKISADLFGLSTVNKDNLGIGQIIEDAYDYFDYVSPMIYPSHYASGFLGYKNPAQYPYEVVRYSMENALERLRAKSTAQISSSTSKSKLRPWLQDFDLGAVYDEKMLNEQIRALYDVFSTSTNADFYNGWMIWNPSNNYTNRPLDFAEGKFAN